MTPTDEIDDPTWHDIFDRDDKIKKLNAELDAVRAALMWGSNETVWPPGMSMSDSIAMIVEKLDDAIIAIESAPCEVAGLGEMSYECRVDNLCRVCSWRNDSLRILKGHETG